MIKFIKTTFSMAAFFGFLFFSSYSNSAPILSFYASNSNPTIGETILVDILATDVPDLFAFNLDVEFNSSVLSSTSVAPGSFLNTVGLTLGDLGFLGFDSSNPGEISNINDSLLGALAGATGSGVLATLSFDVVGSGTSNLSFLNVNALAGTELTNSVGLSINIVDAEEATLAVASVPEPSGLFLMGVGLASLLIGRRYRPHKRSHLDHE